jgi:hypothetical protein
MHIFYLTRERDGLAVEQAVSCVGRQVLDMATFHLTHLPRMRETFVVLVQYVFRTPIMKRVLNPLDRGTGTVQYLRTVMSAGADIQGLGSDGRRLAWVKQ